LYQEALPLVRPVAPVGIVVSRPLPPAPPADIPATRRETTRRGPIFEWVPRSIPGHFPQPEPIALSDPEPLEGGLVSGTRPPILGDGLVAANLLPPPPPPPPAQPVVKTPESPVVITSELLAGKLIHKVVPVYPALARQARVAGTVRLQGVVSKDGTIRNLQVLSGHPLLIAAAMDAVRQWLYRPTVLNGQPVEVIAPIDVIFTLQN
jgi:periplasmic protein TonB